MTTLIVIIVSLSVLLPFAVFLFDFLGSPLVEYLVGALVGLLYPAKSRRWARWQFCGLALGVSAVVFLADAAFLATRIGPSRGMWPAIVFGLTCLMGYLVIGNVCRKCHEGRPGN